MNAGRFVQTAGLFLLGCYIGRKRLFEPSGEHFRVWVRILICASVAFAPLYTLRQTAMEGDAIVRQTVGTVFDMWQKLAFTLVLVASFVLSYRNGKFAEAVGGLRFYGRMSLTNYIAQSVLGAFVYFPFGLYLAPHCGYTASLAIGLLIFLLQMRFCKRWLSGHRQGPLEYVWHRWTWLGAETNTRQPGRKWFFRELIVTFAEKITRRTCPRHSCFRFSPAVSRRFQSCCCGCGAETRNVMRPTAANPRRANATPRRPGGGGGPSDRRRRGGRNGRETQRQQEERIRRLTEERMRSEAELAALRASSGGRNHGPAGKK